LFLQIIFTKTVQNIQLIFIDIIPILGISEEEIEIIQVPDEKLPDAPEPFTEPKKVKRKKKKTQDESFDFSGKSQDRPLDKKKVSEK
jgi:hypothetical protein